ncbi:hypothetical protein CONPUDRAFT_152258 [Coniophora puteana RWD-64-598 SS2]|uniref:Uncharacterized protein n=1 Tax=Coniophora puteana (strain RWD-64-598) TaxID=741705 RepID=A0A5M3MWT7_CONPW|nr:uncharacterized protein CONPUDRAFT_152258 [Coniophora puteana RWD-64-598 SS2]EIW83224.1 hypothetical protein CONPUDRAFT_152258 [Coniophora puteana RWD-64-598 SS2]
MSRHAFNNGRSGGLHRRAANLNKIDPRFSPTASYPGATFGLIPIPGQDDPTTKPEAASPTPDPKATSSASTPDASKSVTPATSAALTTPATTSASAAQTSSASAASSSSIPATTSSASSTTQASTSVSVATGAPTTSIAVVTPNPTVASPTGLNLQPSSTISSPSATSTSTSSVHTSTVIGGVVGGLAALALIGFVVMRIIRRSRKDDDDDEFNPNQFRRQSVMLMDDPPPPVPPLPPMPPMPSMYNNPRPPNMVERHMNASPALAQQQAYGQQNFYGSFPSSGLSFLPGDVVSHPGSPAPPPPAAYNQHPMALGDFADAAGIARQPSNATAGYAVQRRPSNANAAFGAPAAVTEQHYLDLNRSSVSPYQEKQYAEISRHLSSSGQGQGMRSPPAPQSAAYVHPIPEEYADLPSPFEDAHAAKSANAAAAAPAPAAHPQKEEPRPVSTYTMYDEGDAYGGM